MVTEKQMRKDCVDIPLKEVISDSMTRKYLERAGYTKLGQVLELNREKLISVKGVGEKRATEIERDMTTYLFDKYQSTLDEEIKEFADELAKNSAKMLKKAKRRAVLSGIYRLFVGLMMMFVFLTAMLEVVVFEDYTRGTFMLVLYISTLILYKD